MGAATYLGAKIEMAHQRWFGEVGDVQNHQTRIPPTDVGTIAAEYGVVHGAASTLRPGPLFTRGGIHAGHPPAANLLRIGRIGEVRGDEELVGVALVAPTHRDEWLIPVRHPMDTLARRVEKSHFSGLIGLRNIEESEPVRPFLCVALLWVALVVDNQDVANDLDLVRMGPWWGEDLVYDPWLRRIAHVHNRRAHTAVTHMRHEGEAILQIDVHAVAVAIHVRMAHQPHVPGLFAASRLVSV